MNRVLFTYFITITIQKIKICMDKEMPPFLFIIAFIGLGKSCYIKWSFQQKVTKKSTSIMSAMFNYELLKYFCPSSMYFVVYNYTK